jgi:signal transduction histidine kinase
VLDVSFAYLQSKLAPRENLWLERSFRLIEAELAAATPESRDAVATRLGQQIGLGVQLLHPDDIVTTADPHHGVSRLADSSGRISYLRSAPSIAASIHLGPVEPPRESILLRMLPPLFYLSIFVVVGLWLRPLLRDVDLMTRAAQRFAADYRKPLTTAEHTSQLSVLARNLDEMSARLSGLIQSQKELTAALSHEMRTPLARIRFALAIVSQSSGDELEAELAEINADVQEIDGLIASILNYARLDHPDLRMNWQLAPLAAWLRQTLDGCRQQQKALQIVGDDAVDAAWMDPRLMALALSNLVVNACRYAREKVTLTVSQHGAEYQLAVEDDGEGIPESARGSVFKAFTRLDTSRNRATGGHGLGLAIVTRIAALHGGTVAVDNSTALGGARFTLRWVKAP